MKAKDLALPLHWIHVVGVTNGVEEETFVDIFIIFVVVVVSVDGAVVIDVQRGLQLRHILELLRVGKNTAPEDGDRDQNEARRFIANNNNSNNYILAEPRTRTWTRKRIRARTRTRTTPQQGGGKVERMGGNGKKRYSRRKISLPVGADSAPKT